MSVPASKPAGVRKSDRQQSLKKTKEISKTVKLEPDLDVSLEALQTRCIISLCSQSCIISVCVVLIIRFSASKNYFHECNTCVFHNCPPPPPPPSSTLPKDTPVTQVQNFLKATTLHDLSLQSEETLSSPEASSQEPPTQLWRDIDQAEAKDPLFSAQYAPYIYAYMRQREVCVIITSLC